MGILSEPSRKQRELYSSRDRELIEKREFYWSQAEHYPLLEDVIRGRAKFSSKVLGLQRELEMTLPRVVRIMGYSGFPKEPYSIPYTDALFPFVEMLSDLTGASRSVDYKKLLGNILTGRVALYSQKTWDQLKHFFLGLIGSAVVLDKSVRRHFLDVLVQENPEAFKEEYRRMNADDREYAEYTLSRMLGAGILKNVDEIELERIIWDAREQARGDDDDTE